MTTENCRQECRKRAAPIRLGAALMKQVEVTENRGVQHYQH